MKIYFGCSAKTLIDWRYCCNEECEYVMSSEIRESKTTLKSPWLNVKTNALGV